MESNREQGVSPIGENLIKGLWLSVPTTLFLSLFVNNELSFVPANEFTFSLLVLAFASGLPWNLIVIPIWAVSIGGNEFSILLTFHFIATTINGTLIASALWTSSLKDFLFKILKILIFLASICFFLVLLVG